MADPNFKMLYLGVLNLLAHTSVQLRDTEESEEIRDRIECALIDASAAIPRLRWKRILNSFEIELVD